MDDNKRMSWSRMELLHLCPRKYYHRYEEQITGGTIHEYTSCSDKLIRLPISYDYALAFGTAWHAALQSIYDGTAFEKVHCPCDDTCDFCDRLFFTLANEPHDGFYKGRFMYKCIAQFLLHYPWEPDPITEKKNPRTKEKGVALIHAYLDKWRRESFEVVAVEQEFELPFYDTYCSECEHHEGYHQGLGCSECIILANYTEHFYIPKIRFTYVGVIDLLARAAGKLSPWDHKTADHFGEQFEGQFRLSGQFTGYINATNEATGETVDSAWANGAKVSGPAGPDSFLRLETTRTPEEIEEWKQDVSDAWDLIQLYRTLQRWPKHAPQACFAYNHRCEYYALCAGGGEELKANNYVKILPRE